MEREYYRQGRFLVTADIVRARRRSIQLSTIEGIEITRPLFSLALAGCVGIAGVGLVFGDLLYPHEIALFVVLGAGLIALAWNVGELRVFSKLTRNKGWALYWWIKPLYQMREAIEAAMLDRARSKGRGKAPPEDDSDATIRQPRGG